MGEPTVFIDDAAVTAREAEVPEANFNNGMNLGGSNACGIGINMNEGAIVGSREQFTLLDQLGLARVPQISQHIGGYPFNPSTNYPSSGGQEGTLPDSSIRFGDNPTAAEKAADPALDGTVTLTGNCTLNTLAEGWVTNV
jgi:hypothetical protein